MKEPILTTLHLRDRAIYHDGIPALPYFWGNGKCYHLYSLGEFFSQCCSDYGNRYVRSY